MPRGVWFFRATDSPPEGSAMPQALMKTAIQVCKSIMRNGYDAYIVNAPLQYELLAALRDRELDLATDAPFEELARIFPNVREGGEEGLAAVMREDDALFRLYRTDTAEASPPQRALTRATPTLFRRMEKSGDQSVTTRGMFTPPVTLPNDGFVDFSNGVVRLSGLPDEALWRNNLIGIRALRHAANFDLPIEPNTWLAIARASQRILDYVPIRDIMDEWRQVQAENMWRFVKLLVDCQIMHGLIPEVAALSLARHKRPDGTEESILDFTLKCMREYPEDAYAYDWLGTFAVLLHNIGKLVTAEYLDGAWTFYQHHQAGAKMARKILRRLHSDPADINLICHLIQHHMRFHFMMTDKGIRRFMALEETGRLIHMARADIKALGDNYTAFNHNMKYLSRAETPEQMLEPLLNGNEIMEHTGLTPGPHVGVIRQALLKAQIAGEVTNTQAAVAYVRRYAKEMSPAGAA